MPPGMPKQASLFSFFTKKTGPSTPASTSKSTSTSKSNGGIPESGSASPAVVVKNNNTKKKCDDDDDDDDDTKKKLLSSEDVVTRPSSIISKESSLSSSSSSSLLVGNNNNNTKDHKVQVQVQAAAAEEEAPEEEEEVVVVSYGEEVIGNRLKIYWPDDDEWYPGCVKSYDRNNKKHGIEYDDGECEDILLSNQSLEWITGNHPNEKRKRNPSKRRVIDSDDDESSDDEFGKPSSSSSSAKAKATTTTTAISDNNSINKNKKRRQVSKYKGGSISDDDDDESDFIADDDDSEASDDMDDDDDDDDLDSESDYDEDDKRPSKRSKPAVSTSARKPTSLSSSSLSGSSGSSKKVGGNGGGLSTPASSRGSGGNALSRLGKMTPKTSSSLKSNNNNNKTPMMMKSGGGFNMMNTPGGSSTLLMEHQAETPLKEGTMGYGSHKHFKLDWLMNKRMDFHKRPPNHPDFNPRTIYIPKAFIDSETPAMQQWWEFKKQNFDTILFFKVGKFYEIFHMDADVAVKELDLIYMKGEKAHAGFPEIAYGKFANILVERGYRVARVEQTETPDMMKNNNITNKKNGIKNQKVVRREVCNILSKGTRTYCYMETTHADSMVDLRGNAVLLSIKERMIEPSTTTTTTNADDDDMMKEDNDNHEGEDKPAQPICEYGICMVDAPTASFQIGQFADDHQRTRLRTLLTQYTPAEILIERDGASTDLKKMIKFMAPNAVIEELSSGEEFPDKRNTVKKLRRGKYFASSGKQADDGDDDDDDNNDASGNGNIGRWPNLLQAAINGGKDSELAICSLGGAIWQLGRALIDHDLLSMERFSPYIPPDDVDLNALTSIDDIHNNNNNNNDIKSSSSITTLGNNGRMILDGISLHNLEILRNSADGSEKGSLWHYMNRCSTAFGMRIFREWLCKPLLEVNNINKRLDAVEELMSELSPEADQARKVLKKIPDIERMLFRVHSLGSVHKSKDHPDSRAIMYETDKYNERKILDFLSLLNGFKSIMDLSSNFEGCDVNSVLLKELILPKEKGGNFPDLTEELAFFDNAFDHVQAKKDKMIKPREGMDPAYDDAKEAIKDIEKEFDAYLKEQQNRMKCKSICYWGSNGKDRKQLEIPESALKKNLPADYISKSKKKGYRRFHTETIIEILERLTEAEEDLAVAQRDQMRRIFERFDKVYDLWAVAVQSVGVLDCLLSLASVSGNSDFARPTFEAMNTKEPFISIKDGRHPTIAEQAQGWDFIPNDTQLGSDGTEGDNTTTPRILILSGPNMGGKSTLLRQTCILAIMAQMGCFVPAESCHMTPVDRIFTRVGASDRILEGQSTFFVELSETANILHHATKHSLVILDELGRGTSTFDGTAIAHAVIKFLIEKATCRTLFATHYHSLVEEWEPNTNVFSGHMDCMVEPNSQDQRVTFLYKLTSGSSPKSYGINVARLARLPDAVLQMALEKSSAFEDSMNYPSQTNDSTTAMEVDDEVVEKDEESVNIDDTGKVACKLLSILENITNSSADKKKQILELWSTLK